MWSQESSAFKRCNWHTSPMCIGKSNPKETMIISNFPTCQRSFLPSKPYLLASVRDHHQSWLKLVSTLRCKTSTVLTYPRSCSWGKPEEWKTSITRSDWLPELHPFVGLWCWCTVCPPLSGMNTYFSHLLRLLLCDVKDKTKGPWFCSFQ